MTPSTAPTLETLPLIVLERICEYLAQCDSNRRSLWAFSLASRCCCAVSAPERFSQIVLTVLDRNKLQDDLRRCSEVLVIHGRARHVRRLKILGAGPQEERESRIEEWERPDAPVSEQDGGEEEVEEFGNHDIRNYFDVQEFCRPCEIPVQSWLNNNMPLPQQGDDYTEAWKPLGEFIGQLPGLEDLVWAYTFSPPRYILSAVHTVGCRLHMHNFHLGSLIQHRDQPHSFDPDEYALATSPCLHSIVVPYYDYDTFGNVDYSQEAVLRMVTGAAPELAHVWMLRRHPGNSIDLINAFRAPRPAWSGFFPGTTAEVADEPPRLGSLQSLVIGYSGLSQTQITNWSRHTDFVKLRCLTIHWIDDSRGVVESLQTLAEMAMSGGCFQSLHMLRLSISDTSARQMQEVLMLLLEHLNPLETLDLTGFISNTTFRAALRRHGGTLRQLRVIPYRYYGSRRPVVDFSEAVIQLLVQHCPNLEHVEFPVNRTHGDGRETGTYRALSRLPRLKHVSLKLQFSIGSTEDDHEEEGDREDEQERVHVLSERMSFLDIRDAFTNGAMDSSLALSIFNLISSGGSVKYLKLQIGRNEGPGFYDGDFNDILAWIGRSWVCERDDVQGKVSVRELGKKTRVTMGDELKYLEEDTYLAVWNDIWPQRTSDWWENWKSLPLSEIVPGP